MTPRVEVGSEEGGVAWIKSIISESKHTSQDQRAQKSIIRESNHTGRSVHRARSHTGQSPPVGAMLMSYLARAAEYLNI